jgi:hypothetical protein
MVKHAHSLHSKSSSRLCNRAYYGSGHLGRTVEEIAQFTQPQSKRRTQTLRSIDNEYNSDPTNGSPVVSGVNPRALKHVR